jgi:hypothetical protein
VDEYDHVIVVEFKHVESLDEDELGNRFGRFNVFFEYLCIGESTAPIGVGMTSDEALEDFAATVGIPLWHEEDYKKERK